MRISDWSSAVCSSDLHAAGENQEPKAGRRVCAGLPLHAPRERHEAERIDGGVRKIVEAIGDQGAGIAYRAGDKECRGNRRIEKKHDPQRSPFTIHIRILLRHRMSLSVSLPKKEAEHVRSEEHTSELQSLMRSSYAVF